MNHRRRRPVGHGSVPARRGRVHADQALGARRPGSQSELLGQKPLSAAEADRLRQHAQPEGRRRSREVRRGPDGRGHRPEPGNQVHPPFTGLDQLYRLFLAERVVKDNPVQAGKTCRIPIGQIRLQDDPLRPFVRQGEAFHQLIWARAPRAGAVDDSPVLLAPPDLAIKLAVAEMHGAELG